MAAFYEKLFCKTVSEDSKKGWPSQKIRYKKTHKTLVNGGI
jgi:hypothetical protein